VGSSAAAFELAPARDLEDAVGRAALSIVIALPWAVLVDADVPMWCCEGLGEVVVLHLERNAVTANDRLPRLGEE
jgi:hypothetical protein